MRWGSHYRRKKLMNEEELRCIGCGAVIIQTVDKAFNLVIHQNLALKKV